MAMVFLYWVAATQIQCLSEIEIKGNSWNKKNKSIFPFLRDEEKMLQEENIVPGTMLTVVAAAWQ